MTDETDTEVSVGEGLEALAESVETVAVLAAITGSFTVAGGLAVYLYMATNPAEAGSGVTLAAAPGLLLLAALGIWALVELVRDAYDYTRNWRSEPETGEAA